MMVTRIKAHGGDRVRNLDGIAAALDDFGAVESYDRRQRLHRWSEQLRLIADELAKRSKADRPLVLPETKFDAD
jgi:hypothetical protein